MSKTRGIVLEAETSRDVEPGVVTLYDRSRFANNGTFAGTVGTPIWVQLPSGLWVLDFTAANAQYINFGTPESINNISNAISVEIWFNLKTAVGFQRIFNTADAFSGGVNYGIDIIMDGTLFYGQVCGTLSTQNGQWADRIADVWHYATFTYNRVQNLTYGNGVLISGDTIDSGTINNTTNVYLGRRNSANTQNLNGYIGMLNIYNYALTPGQVLQRFEATRSLFGV
ncbi:MAG: LamG domain-containing protein [Deltaproteobacteria bacterium]|nr:LamG domain-containing protein [Deltaproteobacteria bacterium]